MAREAVVTQLTRGFLQRFPYHIPRETKELKRLTRSCRFSIHMKSLSCQAVHEILVQDILLRFIMLS